MLLQIKLQALKLSALVMLPLALCGCLGGSVAQHLVSSILLHGADQATASAMDAHERNSKIAARNKPLENTAPNEVQRFLFNSGFKPVDTPLQIQTEAIPLMQTDNETAINVIQESKLVSVEVWNLLIGDEKQHLLEKARLQGSTLIPPKDEWSHWQIAVGAADIRHHSNKQTAITFLIPPDIGKMRSGAKALVELSNAGELSIARYPLN